MHDHGITKFKPLNYLSFQTFSAVYPTHPILIRTPECVIMICPKSLLHRQPLLRRKTLWRPRMNRRNLRLERRIHQPMPGQHILALELRRDDNRHECLAASAGQILNLDILRLQLLDQLGAQRVGRDTGLGGIGHGCCLCGVDGGVGAGGGSGELREQ